MIAPTILDTPWIAHATLRPEAELRLFCFPYAGGGASLFRSWGASLPPMFEVLPIQLHGRESRAGERPFSRLRPLVQILAQVLYPYLDKPFAFFGHSMGALISFELTRQLREQFNLMPEILFVSAHSPPQHPNPYASKYLLPPTDFAEMIQDLNGTPKEILANAELMEFMLPTVRADFTICGTYTYWPEEPLSCPIVALGGSKDKDVNHEELIYWKEQTRSTFESHVLPGDHFFINSNREAILEIITQAVERLR